MVVGFKFWFGDGTKRIIRVQGRSREDVQRDIDALPSSGYQIGMIYFDEHSQVRCPSGHVMPFATTHGGTQEDRRRRCKDCHAPIDDVAVRYRRIVYGNDHYFLFYDEQSPPPLRDWVLGQSDKESDVARYPQAKYLAGGFVSDAALKFYEQEAMNDYDVSAFGLTPEAGTTDR